MAESKTKTGMNNIKDLICHIKVMYYNNDPILNGVENVNTLYNALCDLNEIVGMNDVKESIIKQIKFLLMNYTGNKSKFEGHMLHTVVFGPPGVGKTTVGQCLANIWKGLGLISKKKLDDKFSKKTDRNIKILPIPIFLLKDRNDKDQDDLIDKVFNSGRFDINDNNEKTSDEEKPKVDKKCVVHISKNKKKYVERIDSDDHAEDMLQHLKVEMDDISHQEQHTLDDKRGYLTKITENKRKVRQTKLLSFGVKNAMKDLNKEPEKPSLNRSRSDDSIKIVSRPDFVGQYVGHTSDKTGRLLTNTLEEGKVLFIDEAYSIVLDEKDSFGHEALNELNRFMSEHPELVVIFAGYKDKIENTLFKYQPGFKRRCTWMFEISDYTASMLADIFTKQLNKDGWKFIGSKYKLESFFDKNIKYFDAFGGDTIRMALYCKLHFSEIKFDNRENNNELGSKTINMDILESAYTNMYIKNKQTDKSREVPYPHMYS